MRAADKVIEGAITRVKAVARSLDIETSTSDSSEALKALACNLIDSEEFRNQKATLDDIQHLMTVADEYEWAPTFALKMLVYINSKFYLKPFGNDHYTRLFEFSLIEGQTFKDTIELRKNCIRLIVTAVAMVDPDKEQFKDNTSSLKQILSQVCDKLFVSYIDYGKVFVSYTDYGDQFRLEIEKLLTKSFWSCDVLLETTLDHIPMTHRVLQSERHITKDGELMKLAHQWPPLAHRVLGHYLDNFMQDANIKQLFKLMQKAGNKNHPASLLTMAILRIKGLRLPGEKKFIKQCIPNFQKGYNLLREVMKLKNVNLDFKAIFVLAERFEQSTMNLKSNRRNIFDDNQDLLQSYKLFKLLVDSPCVDEHLQREAKEKLIDAEYHLALIKKLTLSNNTVEVFQVCVSISEIAKELKAEKEANSHNGSLGTSPIYEEGRFQHPIRSSTWTAGLTANFAKNGRRNGVNGVGHNSLNGSAHTNGVFPNGTRTKFTTEQNGRKKLSKSAVYGSPSPNEEEHFQYDFMVNGSKNGERKKLSKSTGYNKQEHSDEEEILLFNMEMEI